MEPYHMRNFQVLTWSTRQYHINIDYVNPFFSTRQYHINIDYVNPFFLKKNFYSYSYLLLISFNHKKHYRNKIIFKNPFYIYTF